MTQPEQILPGYQLLHVVGRGNTSVVRLAIDPEGQRVAVKLPHSDTLKVHEAAERFGNEVRLSLQFRHPNIVQAFAGTPFGPQAFLALQYYPNGALSDHLAEFYGKRSLLPLLKALSILSDTASALAYLHELGAVHQDVKTQNIYVDEGGRAALGDLGSAYFTLQGSKVSGSPYYMAPEIYHGESSSSASDVYSLGIMMYELLAGERPFNGDTYEELMIAHMTRFAAPLRHLSPQVPRNVARLAEKALAKRPGDRPSAETIRCALLAALGGTAEVAEVQEPEAPVSQVGRHGPAAHLLGTAKTGPAKPEVTKPGAAKPSSPSPVPSKPLEPKKSWNPFKRKK